MDADFLRSLSGHVERRTLFSLSITDRHLYLTIAGQTLETVIGQHSLLEPDVPLRGTRNQKNRNCPRLTSQD